MQGKLRIGVVGTGSVVREIYQYLYFRSRFSSIVEVVAACDTLPDSLAWFCDRYSIPRERRFTNYKTMIDSCDLDAVAINTPDSFHCEPACRSLEAGLDVIIPKPTASTVKDAHLMIETAKRTGQYLGVDYHKRADPVVREATARHRSGEYGSLQLGWFSMLDKLLVADPNHEPRFFASANFAADNSPITFLTSHMSDTIMTITDMRPSKVEATGFRQKLKSLEPVPSDGYDTVDTTIRFTSGAVCHVVTGWTLPNTANTLTVQRGRLLYTDGMLDLWNESYGYHEVSPNGIADRNVLFMNRNPDETYSGYGIDNPGRILTEIVSLRGNEQPPTKFDPVSSGVLATLVCECATASLARGNEVADGVVAGEEIDARDYLVEQIGPDSAGIYL